MKIGKMLARVREELGMSQKELAKKMGVSPSRVSRMEDQVLLDQAEIDSFLKAIGTSASKAARDHLKQQWKLIEKPDFFNPSREQLWVAESALGKIESLKREIDKTSVFYKQLEMHEETIRDLAAYLSSTEHTIACIGSIGVGKTTAICGFLGLKNGGKPVLHTGGGRSTVCEVQVQKGPEWGITIDPLSEDEVYKFVNDFCDYLLIVTSDKEAGDNRFDAETYTLSREIERCIRNMANLPTKRFKGKDGYKQEDQAADLVKTLRAKNDRSEKDIADDLKIEVIIRMNFENRKKTEVWYSREANEDPLAWMKKAYFEINHGRRADFTIPRRITINMPDPILDYEKLELRIIDTKGVDDNAKREDLETHIHDPRALTVFCSRFLDAPDETTRTLIERTIEAGIKDRLPNETALLVLPRNDEAIDVNTLDGSPIEEAEEGYIVRSDDIQSDLLRYDLRAMPVWFYDEKNDSSDDTRKFLIARIERLRSFYENRMAEVADTVDKVADNIEDAQAKAAFDQVLKSIRVWIDQHKDIEAIGDIHDNLIHSIQDRSTYAASVRASVNRRGSWYNLDYYYQIGFGTRSKAVKSISEMFKELNTIIKNLQRQEGMEPAKEFLNELLHFCSSESERMYQDIQRLGQEVYRNSLYDSEDLWGWLQLQWGQGPGYKIRVSNKTQDWFLDLERQRLNDAIQRRIASMWKELLEKFEDLVVGVFA
jgi:transcriptional regulator with XRE-family HTH domain